MTVALKSMADFKRFLSDPRAVVQPIRHDIAASAAKQHRPYACAPRKVRKLQTKSVAFAVEGERHPIWLSLYPAKAFRFEGDEVTYDPRTDGRIVIFRCSLEGDATTNRRSHARYRCLHTSDDLFEQLREQGFYLYRETFQWGRTDGFRHEDGRYLYVEQNVVRTPEEQFTHLMDNWRPAALADRDYFCRMAAAGRLL